ncbi:unnamed protein product, partial [Prorocentrum cordatum]
ECAVMLLSTRSGGLGLNLQVADTVVLFDSDWNPQVDLQAIDRVHRIGQHREVLVVRLMTPTAFDQGLLERTSRKRDLERKVIMAGRFHERLDGEEGGAPLLRQLVRDARAAHGQAPACPAATPLQEANRLLARSPEENAAFEDADIALLGAPAPGQAGRIEGAAERLERCGRLVTAAETAKVPAAARALPKMARRKKEASTAGAVRRRRQRRAQRQ